MSTERGRIYSWRDVASPLNYHIAAVGNVSLRHRPVPPSESLPVVSVREAMFSGERAQSIRPKQPVIINELREGETLWMTDMPQEVREARDAVRQLGIFTGARVLVGGLGIGLIARLLTDAGARVEVVEINQEIVDLLRKASPKALPYRIHVADIYDYLRTLKRWRYDCAFFDTWRGTSEGEWWDSVFPLRRIIGQKFGSKRRFLCWQEETMLGQVLRRLTSDVPPHWHYKAALNLPMTPGEAVAWVRAIGTPAWERKYGAAYPENATPSS